MLRNLSAAAVLAFLAVTSVGCGAPEPSYSALDDDAMLKLFPTATEAKTALGDINTITGPRAETPNPNSTPPANDGMSQECYDAAYGGFTTTKPTRMFVMNSSGSGGPTFVWVLAQRPSADDVRKNRAAYEDRVRKCSNYMSFDAGTSSGNNYATKASDNEKGIDEGASAFVTNGDVSMVFAVTDVRHEEAEDLVRKMAPVMEKRLKASAPKS